jgi:hypothetical protein
MPLCKVRSEGSFPMRIRAIFVRRLAAVGFKRRSCFSCEILFTISKELVCFFSYFHRLEDI